MHMERTPEPRLDPPEIPPEAYCLKCATSYSLEEAEELNWKCGVCDGEIVLERKSE